jgi:hypothetical protein
MKRKFGPDKAKRANQKINGSRVLPLENEN